jgi:acetyl esterase/lipase
MGSMYALHVKHVEAMEWAAGADACYVTFPNLTYTRVGEAEVKLDFYQRKNQATPVPTVLFMHGGFWAVGQKENSVFALMPWFEMGWNVVNVEYRLAAVARAPGAVEDCRSALRYVRENAATYNVDVKRIVLTGQSAGGHLALMTAMAAEQDVAAVLNWYGVTDVADVIDGPNRSELAARWVEGLPDREEMARRLSPLNHVRAGLPPVLTIHGDQDQMVPYAHAVRLHEALESCGVRNRLLTIPGGKHGQFTAEERVGIYQVAREFLGA